MKLFPQSAAARRRRNCAGFLDLFGGNKSSTSSTATTTEVNSRNRTFNSSTNNSNSGNLNLSIGGGADPFGAPGDTVKITAVIVGGLVLAVALAVKLWKK